ncbi:MAG: ABC transporter ATP-binding protein [Lachnospiraceae bacterium]|jgi:putative ABC transport system ATP-binding protein|nr:ABC transporter ATP-binding protein [Lachnospiraceae bacterium]
MKEILKTEQVTRSFPVAGGNFLALKGISVVVPENTLTILKGRSGSGKTTLLNIIGALDAPTSGTVIFDGKDISKAGDKDREVIRRHEIGYIFQSVALIPVMNAYENIEYALRLANYKGNYRDRVMECLKLVGLSKRATHMPQELSGGEQQRVAIARAIAHKPKIIFADEPTGELDSATSLQVIAIFKELIEKEGITFVMTTHDPKLMGYGDVVYEIQDGEIINTEYHGKGEQLR